MKARDVELLRTMAEVEDSIDPESLAGKLGWRLDK